MTPQEIVQLGAAGILAIIAIAFYTDKVRTTKQCQEAIALVTAMWQERFADMTLDRDGWKAQAQQLAPAVGKMADELEITNQRDEEWRDAFQAGHFDRRET